MLFIKWLVVQLFNKKCLPSTGFKTKCRESDYIMIIQSSHHVEGRMQGVFIPDFPGNHNARYVIVGFVLSSHEFFI